MKMTQNKRTARMYGLFEVNTDNGRRKYIRLYPNLSFKKDTAIRVFQNDLLAFYFGAAEKPRELRPIK